MTILITGATGFFGQKLLLKMAKENNEVFVLVREKSLNKISNILSNHKNITPVIGDITGPDIFNDSETIEKLKSNVKVIIHAAAFYDLEGDSTACFINNIMGTQNLLHFASECSSLENLHYISTIAVAGNYKGEFPTSELELGQSFDNPYARTKFEAEKIVRQFYNKNKTKISLDIYRLGVLVGDSETGEMSKIDGPYYFFKFLSKLPSEVIGKKLSSLTIMPFPLDQKAKMPIIPVNHAVDIVLHGTNKTREIGHFGCYHLVSMDYPRVEDFVVKSLNLFDLSPKLLPVPYIGLYKSFFDKIGLPKELLSYMYSQTLYDLADTFKEFPELKDSCFEKYQVSFFRYAKDMF